MELVYILAIIIFLILAKTVKNTNKMLSKIFTTVGICAVILTFTNPMISKICILISVLFFIFLLIKFWLNSIKMFIIILVIFVIALSTTSLGAYFDFKNLADNLRHGVEDWGLIIDEEK